MKALISVLCFLVTSMAMAAEKDFLQALRSYEAVEPATPADLKLALADGLLKDWADLDEADRFRLSHKVFTVHFFKAQLLASAGKPKEAAQELVAELKLQSDHDGKLEYSTESPDLFFASLVELQARLTAENGADPLAGAVDYVFGKEGEGFMVARFEPWDQIKLSTMPVAEGEKLAVVHRITKKNGSFEVTSTKWVVVPEGKLREVLKKARREITSDEDGKLITRELK